MFHFVNEVWDFNSGFFYEKNVPAGSSWRLPVLLAFEPLSSANPRIAHGPNQSNYAVCAFE
jgi:hypothetical protein